MTKKYIIKFINTYCTIVHEFPPKLPNLMLVFGKSGTMWSGFIEQV